MDIQQEKDGFLNVFQFFKSFKGIGFSEETEQFFLKKNKPNDAECLDVSNLNQMWRAWWARAKAQAVPEGFVLMPRVITDEWMAVYVDPVVTKYCKDYEDLPFSVEESELPEIRESLQLPIRNAHKRLMQVIEAQEQSHD